MSFFQRNNEIDLKYFDRKNIQIIDRKNGGKNGRKNANPALQIDNLYRFQDYPRQNGNESDWLKHPSR